MNKPAFRNRFLILYLVAFLALLGGDALRLISDANRPSATVCILPPDEWGFETRYKCDMVVTKRGFYALEWNHENMCWPTTPDSLNERPDKTP